MNASAPKAWHHAHSAEVLWLVRVHQRRTRLHQLCAGLLRRVLKVLALLNLPGATIAAAAVRLGGVRNPQQLRIR